jgi:hypothetical protein
MDLSGPVWANDGRRHHIGDLCEVWREGGKQRRCESSFERSNQRQERDGAKAVEQGSFSVAFDKETNLSVIFKRRLKNRELRSRES